MANTNIKDGMERGEVRAGELEFSVHCSGAEILYAESGTFTGPISTDQVTNTGSTMLTAHVEMELTGSPYGEGLVYSFNNGGNITGGQFVAVSGGIVIASAALKNVTGIAYGSANNASGGTIPVLMYGLKYVTCADNVSNGDYVIAGSVAHTIQSGGASAAAFGKVIGHASSGGTALVMVGKL